MPKTHRSPDSIISIARRVSPPAAVLVSAIVAYNTTGDGLVSWITAVVIVITGSAIGARLYAPASRDEMSSLIGYASFRRAIAGQSGEAELEQARREIEEEEVEFAAQMLLDDSPVDLDRDDLVPTAAYAAQELTQLFLMLGPPGSEACSRAEGASGPQGGVDVGPRG